MENSMHLEDNNMCYGCGKENEKGLRLTFSFFEEERQIETSFLPSDYYQGWKGIVHGGIMATVLDEAMAKLVHRLGYQAVTASLDVRYKDVAKTMEPFTVRAEVTKHTKRLIFTRAIARSEDGRVVAEAHAKMMLYSNGI